MIRIKTQISELEYRGVVRILDHPESGVLHITLTKEHAAQTILDSFFLTISTKIKRSKQTTQQEPPGEIYKSHKQQNRNRR